jgi:signal peptidase I
MTSSPVLPSSKNPEKSNKKQIFELVRFVLICLAIAVPIRIFIAQPYIVSGESMYPTFHNGEYVIVDQISYRVGHPQRGDVVVFRAPEHPSQFYIKRIIGVPGETVVLDGTTVSVINTEHPDGLVLTEEYISQPLASKKETLLLDHEYFVMGDNRPNSSDSRSWGVLPEKNIGGRAWLRLLPLSRIHLHPGDHRGQYEGKTDV